MTVTGDPEQVGRLVEEERPHLVLLDLMLPGADGIELLETRTETPILPKSSERMVEPGRC